MDGFVAIIKGLYDKDEEDSKIPTIPFARNVYGKTSLHMLADMGDIKHANDLLKILGKSPTHYSSMDIADILGWMISENVPNIIQYLQTRMVDTQATLKIKKGSLKDDATMLLTTSKITMNDKEIRKEFFVENENDVEGRVSVKVIDLPKLHDFNETTA